MKKLNYYSTLVALVVPTFVLQCLTSCSEETDTPISVELMDIQEINSRFAKKIISFDGIETEVSNVPFELLSEIPLNTEGIYEADLEMLLPGSLRTSTSNGVSEALKFQVHAKSSEEQITFNGECLHGIGRVKLYAEGNFHRSNPSDRNQDTLFINLKREAPTAPFAEKTYELTLTEESIIWNDFNYNEPNFEGDRPVVEYAKEGMSHYIKYLKEKTNDMSFRFTFHADGTLDVKTKKAGMADFESLQGRFKYYIADNEIGFIEMESTYATQIAQCLSGDERFDHFTYTLFKETYVFTDLVNIPFSYIMMPDGLRLAIGDRTGIFNLSALLYHWEEITGSAKYMNGATPFSSLYGNWGQKENYSDQIWLNLNEK